MVAGRDIKARERCDLLVQAGGRKATQLQYPHVWGGPLCSDGWPGTLFLSSGIR